VTTSTTSHRPSSKPTVSKVGTQSLKKSSGYSTKSWTAAVSTIIVGAIYNILVV
jgi:hypothetical protein